MELIIFSRIREDLQSWQTRWAFLMACWSQGMCGYLIAYTAVMFFHTLWLDYRICCHKTLRHQDSNVLLFPFSSLCMFYSVALFIFLKYFLFVCISWQRPPCVFFNCNLLLVPLPAILPKISHKCASRASVLHGVNRKSKMAFHLPYSNLFSSGIVLKYKNIV